MTCTNVRHTVPCIYVSPAGPWRRLVTAALYDALVMLRTTCRIEDLLTTVRIQLGTYTTTKKSVSPGSCVAPVGDEPHVHAWLSVC